MNAVGGGDHVGDPVGPVVGVLGEGEVVFGFAELVA